jgi:predicted SAM-dependent methyltransferase
MTEIRRYLDERHAQATRGTERGAAASLVRKVSTHSFRQAAKLHGTRLVHPLSRRRIASLTARPPLRLHLGSAGNYLAGWVNVDLIGMESDLSWDLRSGIPFPDGSAEAVVLEHVIEHFALRDDLDLLAECLRVLAPGGLIRLGVPDFGRYLASYAGDGSFIDDVRPGRPTRLLAVAEVALAHGHRSVWDGETLLRVLGESGFVEGRVCTWGESALDPAPDSDRRKAESVYAEARKPSSA